MYCCGIDIAKHHHELSLLGEAGETLLSMHFTNSQKGLEKLLNALASFKIEPENVLFCMEAAGHYWLVLYCQLKEFGYQLHVINPIQSDALRNLYLRKAKTDKKRCFAFSLSSQARPGAGYSTGFRKHLKACSKCFIVSFCDGNYSLFLL